MASTFHGLEVGKRALFAQQTALATTGHNIANANTKGYTRQRAELQASNAMPQPGMNASTSPAQLGTGVEVNKIVRLREDYLDAQYRSENHQLGYWDAKSDVLTKMEDILNEPSERGLAHVMDEFWKGWQELAKNPDSPALRSIVKERGEIVADTFNYISDSFDQYKKDLNNSIDIKVEEINSLAKQISSLNDQIGRLVANNYEPNDLYDQRDVLIDHLSKLVPLNVETSNQNGMVDISVGGAKLVSGNEAFELDVSPSDTSSPKTIQIDGASVNLQSGELFGLVEVFGIDKGDGSQPTSPNPNIESQLNEMAEMLIGELKEAVGGTDFFTGDSMATIKVNSELSLDSISRVDAQKIADLKFKDNTAMDTYQKIIGQLGTESQEAMRLRDNSDGMTQQIEHRRQSVSGVSLDEEMVNMIRFQQSYNAAARFITTIDQCLDKVINGMGRVGL